METVKKAQVAKVITDASKNSEYFKTEEEKLDAVKDRIYEFKKRIEEVKKDMKSYAMF